MISPTAVKRAIGLSDDEKSLIKERILQTDVPSNLERQNLILGHTLYGAVSKVTEVFGKNVVDIVWEEVKKVPKDVMKLDDNTFRVYFDDKKGIVEAVEVLKKKELPDKTTGEESKSTTRRQLPKIPKND
jgi:hypothetical protein